MAKKEELLIVATLKGDAQESLEDIGKEGKGSAKVVTKAFNKMEKESGKTAKEIKKDASKMGAGFKKAFQVAAAGAAIAATAIGLVAFQMSGVAASAEELESKFDALFGDGAERAREFGEELRGAVGRGMIETRRALADMRGFTEGLGLASEEADDLAFKITELGIDLSSFYDVEQEDAMQRLRSGLIGNAEALDVFAARISENQLKEYGESVGLVVKDLNDQEKVMLRLELLQIKVNKAMGDAERTVGSFQNQMRALSGGFEDARAEFGKFVNEGIQRAIEEVGGPGKLIDLFRILSAGLAETAVIAIDLTGQAIKPLADSLQGLGGADAAILNLRIEFAELRLGLNETLSTLMKFGEVAQWMSPLALGVKAMAAAILDENEALAEWEERLDKVRMAQEAVVAAVEKQRNFMTGLIPDGEEIDPFTGESRFSGASFELHEAVQALELAQLGMGNFKDSIDPAVLAIIEMKEELEILQDQAAREGKDGGILKQSVTLTEEDTSSALSVLRKFYDKVAAMAKGAAVTKSGAAPAGGGGGGQVEGVGLFDGLEDAADVAADGFANVAAAAVAGSEEADRAWSKFFENLAAQAAQLVAQQAFQALFKSFTTQADGGIEPGVAMANGGVVPFQAFASGGTVNEPTLALMGENPFFKGEAFVPLPDGKSIPVEGGGGGANITFQIQTNDSRGFDQLLGERKETIIGLVREGLARDRNFRQAVGAAR